MLLLLVVMGLFREEPKLVAIAIPIRALHYGLFARNVSLATKPWALSLFAEFAAAVVRALTKMKIIVFA